MSDGQDRIGRGTSGWKLPFGQIVKILMMITAIVALVAMRGPCAQGVANLFNIFAPPVGADAGVNERVEVTPEQLDNMLRDAAPLPAPVR